MTRWLGFWGTQILDTNALLQTEDHPLFERTKRPLLEHWRRRLSHPRHLAQQYIASLPHSLPTDRLGRSAAHCKWG